MKRLCYFFYMETLSLDLIVKFVIFFKVSLFPLEFNRLFLRRIYRAYKILTSVFNVNAIFKDFGMMFQKNDYTHTYTRI